MQEAAFCAAGLKAYYIVCEIHPRYFSKTMKSLHRLPLDGFNVTVPYKEAVKRGLKSLTPEARAVGAVNTVFRKKGQWSGTNTDVYGFITSLRLDAKFKAKGKSVLIFGAGGSARAAAYGLASEGVKEITIVNRHLSRAQILARDFKRQFKKVEWQTISLKDQLLLAMLKKADLIVNCTSLGLKAGDGAVVTAGQIPLARDGKKQCYVDLIYKPAETRFLKQARLKGHKTLNGLGMLLYQGAKAFEYWTGKKAPLIVMRKALSSALGQK